MEIANFTKGHLMKLFAALLIALPLAASAQYEPADPASGPGAGMAPTRRSPWYIGFGLGSGNGSVSGQGETFSLKELHGGTGSPTNVFLNFKVGATLAPGLLLGFDGTALRSQLDEGGLVTAWQINNYDAVLTWFPQGEGLFLRGGAGRSVLQATASDGVIDASDSWSGFNVIFGGGYAFWMGQAFNLTLNADYSIQSYGSSNTDPESSRFFALWVGFDWY